VAGRGIRRHARAAGAERRREREREELPMKYLVESPHTQAECLKELDDVAAKGSDVLGKFSWGCMTGEHTGYAILEARDETEARSFVPEIVRGKARVHPVSTFTPKDIEKFHHA
jgi:hypothetical protein